jgi:hypothetical protein
MLNPVATRRYRAGGFTLESDIAFSGLLSVPVADVEEAADTFFCIGELPRIGEGLTFRRNKFGFTALEGRQVLVSISVNAEPEAVSRTTLTGGLNAIAYQRGLLPLHASAIGTGETCVAFCGQAEVGKSTLAAALAQAGYPLMCDDLAIVHPDRDGTPLVWPAMRPKLTKHSVDLLGGEVMLLTSFAEWDSKAVANVGKTGNYAPRRLACIYYLEWGEPVIRRLSPVEGATMLNRCLRTTTWLEQAGTATVVRQRWLDLVARIPIIKVTQRRDPSAFSALCRSLIDSWNGAR